MSMNLQCGSSKVWVLIVGGLFAALSFALTQFGWKGTTLDEQTSGVTASQVIQHPASLRALVSRMVLTGTPANTIIFTSPGTGQANEIFDPAGGQATVERPPPNIGNPKGGIDGTVTGAWGYKDTTDALLGYYIKGVGSDDDVFGREIFAFLHGVSLSVCKQINKGFAISGVPTQNDAVDYTLNGGKGSASFSIGVNVFIAAPAQPFACIENVTGSGVYDYYHALYER